jgi:hypothetical protein
MRLLPYLLPILSFLISCQQESPKTYLFVGSYTGGESADGIYVYELNQDNGELKNVEIAGNLINPSFHFHLMVNFYTPVQKQVWPSRAMSLRLVLMN